MDLVLARGLYSWDSSSRPFCLLYQSKSVRRMEGRQYSASELILLISWDKHIQKNVTHICASLKYSDIHTHIHNHTHTVSLSHTNSVSC